jgi:septal ring factor EnvC (AmiA/AmiB activator)
MLDRETQDRRTLQGQADALRDQLAAAQLDAAKATGAANTERAMREAAEARARDLQRQVEALEARPRRRWWPW